MRGHGENQEGAASLLEKNKVRVKQQSENQEGRRKKKRVEGRKITGKKREGDEEEEARTVNGKGKKFGVHTPFFLSSTIIRDR